MSKQEMKEVFNEIVEWIEYQIPYDKAKIFEKLKRLEELIESSK